MTVVHLTAKAVGKKRAIVSIETYAPVAPLPQKTTPAPKATKGNKNSK
jgi:Na+-transporting NADH:ubiquinone oxidoreductase subunit NqrA